METPTVYSVTSLERGHRETITLNVSANPPETTIGRRVTWFTWLKWMQPYFSSLLMMLGKIFKLKR